MKTTFLVLVVLATTAAFGQYVGSISSTPQPLRFAENPQHASTHSLAQEQYVVAGSTYTSAQGEKPLWEFQQAPQVPLGDVARTLKEEHAKVKKAKIKFEN